ncbi:MAG: hypothetical protein D6681_06145 [Calditrichaeota bacterium]|nr:MAG: hypothetical protein D6681_06145 [Calditrichota bacterium]
MISEKTPFLTIPHREQGLFSPHRGEMSAGQRGEAIYIFCLLPPRPDINVRAAGTKPPDGGFAGIPGLWRGSAKKLSGFTCDG